MQNKDSLSTKELLSYLAIGIIIGLTYTIWLVVIVDWINENENLEKIEMRLTRIILPDNPKEDDFKNSVEKILEVVRNV